MASSLFPTSPQQNLNQVPATQNDPYAQLEGIANLLKGKDLNKVAAAFAQRNPQFAQFMQSVQGKTPQQFAQEHGIDFNRIARIMR